MNWLSSFLHPEKGYQKGQEQLDKYYNQAQGYQQPYNQNGQDQYNNLQSYIDNLMHPEKLQDEWVKNYTESESAKNAEGMAQQHGLDAASSMGLMGSSPALSAIQAGTSQIGLDDRQKYLDDLMQKYMQGAGLSQGIYNQGANTANGMSNNSMNMGQNSAGLAYGAENSGGNMFSNILGRAIPIGAGFALGGPAGAAAGAGLGNKWSLRGSK